jgi:hypothetical protein
MEEGGSIACRCKQVVRGGLRAHGEPLWKRVRASFRKTLHDHIRSAAAVCNVTPGFRRPSSPAGKSCKCRAASSPNYWMWIATSRIPWLPAITKYTQLPVRECNLLVEGSKVVHGKVRIDGLYFGSDGAFYRSRFDCCANEHRHPRACLWLANCHFTIHKRECNILTWILAADVMSQTRFLEGTITEPA